MKIVLTKYARENLTKILKYIEDNWSVLDRKNFVNNLDNMLNIISDHPYLCVESKIFPGIRRCTLSKQNSLYYKINNDKIIVLMIYDNRQNPDDIQKELNLN